MGTPEVTEERRGHVCSSLQEVEALIRGVTGTGEPKRVLRGKSPKAAAKTHVATKPAAHPAAVKKTSQPAKPADKAAAPAKPVKVVATAHQTKPKPHPVQLHAAASVNLGPNKKGGENH